MTEKSEPGSRGAWGKDLGPSAWISLGSLGTAQVLWVLVSTVGLFENSVGSLGPLKTLRQRCFPPPPTYAQPQAPSHTRMIAGQASAWNRLGQSHACAHIFHPGTALLEVTLHWLWPPSRVRGVRWDCGRCNSLGGRQGVVRLKVKPFRKHRLSSPAHSRE